MYSPTLGFLFVCLSHIAGNLSALKMQKKKKEKSGRPFNSGDILLTKTL